MKLNFQIWRSSRSLSRKVHESLTDVVEYQATLVINLRSRICESERSSQPRCSLLHRTSRWWTVKHTLNSNTLPESLFIHAWFGHLTFVLVTSKIITTGVSHWASCSGRYTTFFCSISCHEQARENIRYWIGTWNHGFIMQPKKDMSFKCWNDSDVAGNRNPPTASTDSMTSNSTNVWSYGGLSYKPSQRYQQRKLRTSHYQVLSEMKFHLWNNYKKL